MDKKYKNDLSIQKKQGLKIAKANLTDEQMTQIANAAMFSAMVEEAKREGLIGEIDYLEEYNAFMNSRSESTHTRKQYSNAIKKLEKYCDQNNLKILMLQAKEADDFILHLRDKKLKLSAATINVVIASCSGFFSFLSRRYRIIQNPFSKTKMKPKNVKNKKNVPNKREVDLIIKNISNDVIKCAVIFLKETGLRVEGLNNLMIFGGFYTTTSKGKKVEANNGGGLPVSRIALNAIRKSKLPFVFPFSKHKHTVIADTFRRVARRLYDNQEIQAKYTVHSLRHYFAVRNYKKNKNIYLLAILLNHSDISITQTYLRSMNLFE